MLKEGWLEDYDQHVVALRAALVGVRAQLERLIDSSGLKIHSVTARLKDRESLRRKLGRPDRNYDAIWDVTDLLGLRVITYFDDEVETVARLVESGLEVDFTHSTDKDRRADGGSFGYRSLHYVCRAPGLGGLPDSLRFEVQIRTTLQHAWAEIEHDLGYKAQDAVPTAVRRRFSRVASLLEVADEEFVAIRRELARREESMRGGLLDSARTPELDRLSLRALIAQAPVRALDDEIARRLGRECDAELFYPEYLLKMLRLAGLNSPGQVLQFLASAETRVRGFIEPYFRFTQSEWKLAAGDLDRVYAGYGLFFLSHVAVIDSPDLELSKVGKLAQFYRELDYPHDPAQAHRVAVALFDAFRVSGLVTP